MLEGLVTLASYGLGTGGVAGNLLFQLEQNGVFSYVLPFLMIFAITYGILDKTGIFKQNGINVILALVVGLMALQMNFVSYFFREIFPRMGVMLSIILVVLILLGLFFDFKSHWVKVFMGIIITIGVIVILVQSLNIFNWIGSGWGSSPGFSYFFSQYGSSLLIGILLFAGVFAVIRKKKDNSHGSSSKKQFDMNKLDGFLQGIAAKD